MNYRKLIISWLLVLSVVLWCPSLYAAEIVVDVPLDGLVLSADANNVAHFSGDDIQFLSDSGEPALPYRVLDILLPVDADLTTVQVILQNYRLDEVAGDYKVNSMPAIATWDGKQVIELWPEGETIVNGKNVGVYDQNASFPANLINPISTGQKRKWKILEVPLALYQYNPTTKKLYQLNDAQLKVTYTPSVSSLNKALLNDSLDEDSVQSSVINFEQFSSQYQTASIEENIQSGTCYAIITTNAIKNNSAQLNAFVASKQSRGFVVNVVTEDEWGGGVGDTAAENIRNWLQANYISLNIEYVLLIGNPDSASGDVPMKMLWPRYNATSHTEYRDSPSDYYYSDLTGDWDLDNDGIYGEGDDDFGAGGVDRNFEVVVGRIPFYGIMSDLDSILAKIISYENADESASSWRDKILLPMEPSDEYTPGYLLSEQIKNDILIPNNVAYHRVYDDVYGLSPAAETIPCTTTNVTNAWNGTDFGATVWWTHGSSTIASSVMSVASAATLDNLHPGFTFQCSCLNSYPEYSSNLTYSLLKNGAIVPIGATRVSWYYIGQVNFKNSSSNAGFAYEYTKRLIDEGMSSGYALHDLKQTLYAAGTTWMNFTVMLIYGDPSIGLHTYKTVPSPPMPENVSLSLVGDESYTISWTASNTATVYEVEEATDINFLSINRTFWSSGLEQHVEPQSGYTMYCYRVRAWTDLPQNGGSGSAWSNELAFVPKTEVDPNVEILFDETIRISWTTIAGAGIYELIEDDNSDFSSPTRTFWGAKNSYKIAPLSFNKTYYYKVRVWTKRPL